VHQDLATVLFAESMAKSVSLWRETEIKLA